MGAASSPLISLRQIDLRLGDRQLFRQLSVDFEPGERWLISAPSGRGKTTLLSILAGNLRVDAGELRFRNHPFQSGGLREYRGELFWLPQFPVLFSDHVGESLLAPFAFKAVRQPRPDSRAIEQVLDRLDLKLSLDQPCKGLSGGQVQRLAIAQGLLLKRPVWILDEPTSGQDDVSCRATIDSVLAQPSLELLIVASHDERILHHFPKHASLSDGRLVQPTDGAA